MLLFLDEKVIPKKLRGRPKNQNEIIVRGPVVTGRVKFPARRRGARNFCLLSRPSKKVGPREALKVPVSAVWCQYFPLFP